MASRALRIAHITFGLDVGGQERLLVEFARRADRAKFELRFVSLGSRGVLGSEVEAEGWPVIALGVPSGLRPSLIVKLARFFHNWRPDVIHTHDHRALFYAGPVAWVSRVPLVVNTRHGRNCHFTPRQVAVGRHLARLVDRYVCVSEDVKAQCVAEGIPTRNLLTIKNGVDVDRFTFSGSRGCGPVVAVGRLSPEKDIANLIRATEMAAKRIPSVRVEVAGNGPCLEELKGLAAELGVGDRIKFLGEVHDVSSLLSRARMFVLPSRSEGIPVTVLEAMACGLPVLATRVGGLPEVVDQGVTGLLVLPADAPALADAIIAIWNDPDRGAQLGSAGRRRVEQHFDVGRMVADYEALYVERTTEPKKVRFVWAGLQLLRL
jgi:glycosyltransferase involved in cell wall biosynthesis